MHKRKEYAELEEVLDYQLICVPLNNSASQCLLPVCGASLNSFDETNFWRGFSTLLGTLDTFSYIKDLNY